MFGRVAPISFYCLTSLRRRGVSEGMRMWAEPISATATGPKNRAVCAIVALRRGRGATKSFEAQFAIWRSVSTRTKTPARPT